MKKVIVMSIALLMAGAAVNAQTTLGIVGTVKPTLLFTPMVGAELVFHHEMVHMDVGYATINLIGERINFASAHIGYNIRIGEKYAIAPVAGYMIWMGSQKYGVDHMGGFDAGVMNTYLIGNAGIHAGWTVNQGFKFGVAFQLGQRPEYNY